MRINLREFLKDRSKEKKKQKERKKIIEVILESFKKEGVQFCILRNYEFLEKESDIDIIVKRHKKINKIMNSYGLYRRYSYASFMSYKGNGIWFDFKVDTLRYHGIKYKDANEIFKNKRKYKGFFILSEKEEFIHLLLHCIIHKESFKEKYKKKIQKLYKDLDKKDLINDLELRFQGYGEIIYGLVEKEYYTKLLKLKKKLLHRMFKFSDIPSILMVKTVFLYGKHIRKFFKKSY